MQGTNFGDIETVELNLTRESRAITLNELKCFKDWRKHWLQHKIVHGFEEDYVFLE